MKWIISLAVLALADQSIAAEKNVIRALPTKPAPEKVREFLAGGVALTRSAGDGVSYVFRSDGLATFSTGGVQNLQCKTPESYRVTSRSVSFECSLIKRGGDSGAISTTRKRLSLEIVQLGPDSVVYRADESWESLRSSAVPDPHERHRSIDRGQKPDEEKVSRSFEEVEGGTIELIPAAQDRALFQQVKSRIQTPTEGAEVFQFTPVFEGPPAKETRIASEIFYVEGQKQSADNVAKLLEPDLGPVGTKPWPGGKWDYDVVVVVGSKRVSQP